MFDSFLQALALLADFGIIAAVLIAVVVGLIIGILPGLGGIFALSILIPFVYGMEPMQGLAFLLAAHAVVNTGGAIPSIVLGIPATPACAATVLDGFPLSRQGRGGYAVGAALSASAAGGIFGAIILVALFPILQEAALLFGSPELLALTLIGLLAVAAIERGGLVIGLISGSLGIFLATFGYQAITGVPRFWFGSDYLLDGFRLVPLLLGLFAIPEILALMQGDPVAASAAGGRFPWREVVDGMMSVVRKWWLLLHSSTVGVLVGIAPGIGGETAGFLAYALAKRSGRAGNRFGAGAIEGVIAPEASNNSKEGGALVPTLAFGIPGSAAMAVLLGGFLVLGLQPGPDFLVLHMDIAIGMALVLAIANVLGVLMLLPFVGLIAKVALVRGRLLAPTLLVFVFAGAYSTTYHPMDVASVFLFGALGHVMKKLNYSRAALVLGFVLGPMIERYLHISLQAYGPAFLARPIVLVLEGVMAGILLWPWAKRLGRRAKP